MANELFSIPGNIKPYFSPFVLEPKNPMHSGQIDVQSATDGTDTTAKGMSGMHTQFFSFRPKAFYENARPERGLFRVTPASFYDTQRSQIRKDISHMLTFSQQEAYSGSASNNNCPAENILENMPLITVREFQQDAKLDMIMNLFSSFGSSWASGTSKGESDATAAEGQSISFTQAMSNLFKALKDTADAGSVIFRNIQTIIKDVFSGVAVRKINDGGSGDLKDYVLQIPHILYYQLMSSTSLNIYELPYNGNVLFESNGTNGYNSRHLLNGIEGSESGMFGVLRNFIGKNIKVNTTPTWDGASDEQGPSVEIEFQLFNDTLESAIRNFIFVNTIVPNNMWLQYHIFQHAPCLYDIRIEGVKRLYMCSGNFTCTHSQPLRRPPKQFFAELNKHLNPHFSRGVSMYGIDVRIPDFYTLKCTFTSLLPNNFNNYLYSYYGNNNIAKQISGDDLHQNSVMNKVMSNLGNELGLIFEQPKNANAILQTEGSLKDYYNKSDDLTDTALAEKYKYYTI